MTVKVYVPISLNDLEYNVPLNETTVYTIIGGTRYDFTDNGDGTYLSEQIPTPVAFFTAQTQVIDVYIERENYETEIVTIVISIGMMEILPGIPTFWFLMIIGAMIAVVGSLLVYRTVQQKRIPTFIKKSKGLIKAISSGSNISDSLIYPSKEVFIAKRFMKNWKIHDLSLSEILGIDKGKKKVKLQENSFKDVKGGGT